MQLHDLGIAKERIIALSRMYEGQDDIAEEVEENLVLSDDGECDRES